MSQTNGHAARVRAPAPPTREQLRELRAENALRVERIRAARLAQAESRETRRRQLVESLSVDWVTPYAELLDLTRRSGDPVLAGPTSYWQRRQGRNWPIYQTEQELNLLRAPARTLLATNGYAQGLVEGLTSYAIGTGCTYRVAKADDRDDLPDDVTDAAQDVVDRILERNQWHGGEQPGLEEELFGRSIEDGEWLLCHYPREDGWTDFRVQEPEQLTQPPGSDFAEYGFGIRTPRDDAQRHLAYWVQHGETPSEGEEYSPDEVTHFRRNVRRGMKRGLTDFCFDTYDSLHLAGRLRTNLGDTAAQQASIVAVRQHDSGSKEDLQAFVDADADLTETNYPGGSQTPTRIARRGSWEDVPKGMNYVPGPIATSTPIHLQVLDACLRGAGQRWQAPPWLMSGDLNAMNYATSLTAESPFVRTIQRRQRVYCEAFRRPVWFALRHYVQVRGLRDRTGRVWSWEELDGRLKLQVTAPSPETRNKLEDAQRAAVEIPLGVQSRQAYMQEQGRNPDQIEADNQAYQDKFGGDGQQLPMPGGDGLPGFTESLFESTSGSPPGPPPHPGLTWKADTHRWINPHTGAEHEHSDWPDHPAAVHLRNSLGKADIPEHQKADYAAAISLVLSRTPAFARDRIARHLSETVFYGDTKSLGLGVIAAAEKKPNLSAEQRQRLAREKAAIESGGYQIGGAYLRHSQSLHIDGGMTATSAGQRMPGAHGGTSQQTAEIHAHELGHAIDGPNWQISHSDRWLTCFEREIAPLKDGEPPLTKYAQTNPQEAFAEYCRLVYAGRVDLVRVEREFPLATKFFKEAKLWPGS